jgi:hypothetical protein
MSLKGFHIVFVTVSMMLFAFLAYWGLVFTPEKNSLASTMGYIGIIGMLLMPIYGIYFIKKCRCLQP